MAKPRRPHTRVEFYVDAAGEHRWRKIAANGRETGASSEGFVDPRGARDNLLRDLPGYRKVDGGLLNDSLAEDDPGRFIPVTIRKREEA